ncbi:MAG: acyl-CoA dehydrogenase, partial [Pseudomonadota bacterium]
SVAGNGDGTITDHADVRRMLATMRAETFAARAIATATAASIDLQNATGAENWAARAAFLTPIAKAFGTECGICVANMGIQVHGGMGFIEETGAAQFLRDVRVTAIYEGTNGIQSMDLVGRKLADGGEAAEALLDEIEDQAEIARATLPDLAEPVWQACESLRDATGWMVSQQDLNMRFAGAVPYLRSFGRVLGAHFHLRAALAEPQTGPRSRLARFYITRLLPEVDGLLAHATAGAEALYDMDVEDFAA